MPEQLLTRWLTEDQASTYIERSPRTLRMWRKHNEVVAHRQSKSRILYSVESLNQCAAVQKSRYQRNVGRPPKESLICQSPSLQNRPYLERAE